MKSSANAAVFKRPWHERALEQQSVDPPDHR